MQQPAPDSGDSACFNIDMAATGFDLGNSETPITRVMLGDVKVARELSGKLFEE